MLFNILALISVIIVITTLKKVVSIFPSLIACIIRWKESVNLEASVKLKRDRDIIAFTMIIPFCLTAARFRLYDPGFMKGLGDTAYLGAIIGTFAAYIIIRNILDAIFLPPRKRRKGEGIAIRCSYSFFIILTFLLLAAGSILTFANVGEETVRCTMLWISGLTYTLFTIRKTQIFINSGSFFAAFLYLCALEFLPTGLLIASGVIF